MITHNKIQASLIAIEQAYRHWYQSARAGGWPEESAHRWAMAAIRAGLLFAGGTVEDQVIYLAALKEWLCSIQLQH